MSIAINEHSPSCHSISPLALQVSADVSTVDSVGPNAASCHESRSPTHAASLALHLRQTCAVRGMHAALGAWSPTAEPARRVQPPGVDVDECWHVSLSRIDSLCSSRRHRGTYTLCYRFGH
ncbi:hypothetical protein EJ04DRAFT_228488 [Polyplosphaeria fusca]|uniref:Uncharacterized protein n=1 Tax=Polyplosphaeria fusca TaxID=682080 RepID=A0A9P4QXV7_9PLEO|nr:hypothetical protein EJ04DRAFT_228488 [Polyplosphaeria fusca]